MITHSPETPMPEPYKTYIHQRANKLAETLGPVVEDIPTQLCSRAITLEEQLYPDGLTYGCVVDSPDSGLKTVIYDHDKENGLHTRSLEVAVSYAETILQSGERVRIKDPSESDGNGQYSISSISELVETLEKMGVLSEYGVVIMPHLDDIQDRFTTGYINLGHLKRFSYIGREYVQTHQDREVFIGGDIGIYKTGDKAGEKVVIDKLHIPQSVARLSELALRQSILSMHHAGRVSVDTIVGKTDTGRSLTAVVDLTPRVGGHTPAEVLGIAALSSSSSRIAFATGRLHYVPKEDDIIAGERFVDTDSLVIAAKVNDVI